MITVRIRYTDGRISSYEVSGHAEYAKHGKDIVCAGVSSLTLSAALGLRDVLNKNGTYRSKEGHLFVEISETDDRTEAILQTMRLGLSEMQKQYSELITIEETGR